MTHPQEAGWLVGILLLAVAACLPDAEQRERGEMIDAMLQERDERLARPEKGTPEYDEWLLRAVLISEAIDGNIEEACRLADRDWCESRKWTRRS